MLPLLEALAGLPLNFGVDWARLAAAGPTNIDRQAPFVRFLSPPRACLRAG